MRTPLAVVAAAVAASCGLVAAPARGAAFQPEGAVAERIASDGKRYLAYTQPDGVTRLVDGREGRVLDIGTPPNCDNVRAIGGGQLAWSCTRGRDRPPGPRGSDLWSGAAMLLDLRTFTIHEPAGLDRLEAEEDSRDFPVPAVWHDVGSHWLLGTETSVAHSASRVRSVALNWHTGEIRRDEPAGRGVHPDASHAGLTRKLCGPLRRQARTTEPLEDETPPFLDFQYARPFGVAQVAHRRANGSRAYTGVLMRCGSRRRIALGPYSRDTIQLGGGRVTWIKGRFAYARVVRSGVQRRWRLPAEARMLVHAAGRLYLLAGRPGQPARLYSAPLP